VILANKKSDYLAFIVVFGVFLILFVHYIRDNFKTGADLTLILGVAPNFISALCCPAVFLGYKSKVEKVVGNLNSFKWFVFCTLLSLAIVIGWEFNQTNLDSLIFDINDIVASVCGAILFLFCWPLLRVFVKLA